MLTTLARCTQKLFDRCTMAELLTQRHSAAVAATNPGERRVSTRRYAARPFGYGSNKMHAACKDSERLWHEDTKESQFSCFVPACLFVRHLRPAMQTECVRACAFGCGSNGGALDVIPNQYTQTKPCNSGGCSALHHLCNRFFEDAAAVDQTGLFL